jgi:Cid1 family poly A polymerase
MIINFLQTREPPILPSLHLRPHQRREFIDGVDVSFDDDLESLRGFGEKNKETLGDLLFHFFRRYGHEIDYEKSVISVRQGKLISKEDKMWHLMQNNRLCVEEPFNIKRNLGNTADDTSVRGLHIELRRAFTLIADEVNLDKCCEQYIWPTEPKPVWEKPPQQPRPVLSRSSSQTGRGGRGGHGNTRGGRHSNNHNFRGSSQQFRRASSGTAIANGPSALLPQHQAGLSPQEYYMQAHHAQNQLHDQLYQSYQFLQAQLQENELRYQLLHQAQAQAQARNQAPSHVSGQASPAPYTNGHPSPHPGALDNPPLTAPVRPGFFFYPLQYPSAVPGQHQPGASTNPSSPSITPAIPELRRSLHRSSVGERTATGSFRSQSQPASRPLPSALSLQGPAASNYGIGGLSAYEQLRQRREALSVEDLVDGPLEISLETNSFTPGPDSSPDEQPKEYVGYYQIDAAQPVHSHLETASLPPVSASGELQHRQRRVSPDQLPPPITNRLRRNSRSISPLGHNTSLVSGPQIGAPTPTFPQTGLTQEGIQSTREMAKDRPVEDRSPLIVNGSTMSAYIDPGDNEPRIPHEEQNCDLCASAFESHAQPQGLASESSRHKLYAQQLLEKHNQAETVRSEPGTASSSHGMGSNHLVISSPAIPASTSPYSSASASLLHWPSDEEGNSSPRLSPNLRQRASRRVSLMPINGIPPLDTSRVTADVAHENNLTATSPLTPVPEMRTPSPTIHRSLAAPFSTDVNGSKNTRNDRKSRSPQPPPTPAGMAGKQKQADPPVPNVNGHIRGSASMGSGTPITWQRPDPKRRKSATKKGLGTGKNNIEIPPGEESERKGG